MVIFNTFAKFEILAPVASSVSSFDSFLWNEIQLRAFKKLLAATVRQNSCTQKVSPKLK